MADISKCRGTGCPLKEKCYRFTAKADDFWQSYFATEPIEDDECEYFWDNKDRI